MRLGESLVESGHITKSQLEKALNAQLIFGGHLGTCLIELGHIDEQTLGNLLARVYCVKYAHPGLLDDIQPQTLAALSQASVEKHMAIPFDLTKRTLRVAMVNPGHVPSLDELFFVSGLRIEAWVSPEVRVFQAMERYYQVPRRVRYITLARSLDEKKSKARPKATQAAVATQAAAVGGAAVALPRLVPIAPSASSDDEEAAGGTPAPMPPAQPPKRKPSAIPGDLETRLRLTAEEFCRAEDIAATIKMLLDHVALDASRCIFFGLKGTEAFVRDVRGFALDAVTAHKVRFNVTTEPLLTLLSGDSFYRGAVPDQPKYHAIFDALHTPPPHEILLLPVHRHDRLAGLLYADGGTQGRIEGETESFLRVMRKFILSLDHIDSRQRIRLA